MASVRQLITSLNALGVGELDRVVGKLDEARRAVAERPDLEEIAGYLDEARAALLAADLKTYRKRVERAVASLGHVPG